MPHLDAVYLLRELEDIVILEVEKGTMKLPVEITTGGAPNSNVPPANRSHSEEKNAVSPELAIVNGVHRHQDQKGSGSVPVNGVGSPFLRRGPDPRPRGPALTGGRTMFPGSYRRQSEYKKSGLDERTVQGKVEQGDEVFSLVYNDPTTVRFMVGGHGGGPSDIPIPISGLPRNLVTYSKPEKMPDDQAVDTKSIGGRLYKTPSGVGLPQESALHSRKTQQRKENGKVVVVSDEDQDLDDIAAASEKKLSSGDSTLFPGQHNSGAIYVVVGLLAITVCGFWAYRRYTQ
jgi:hypothetical protein